MRILMGLIAAFGISVTALADSVIKNVTAITMNGAKVTENATVVVSGDRIIHIGTSVPDGTNVTLTIDGTGKFLVPGLSEMHGHLPSASATSREARETHKD